MLDSKIKQYKIFHSLWFDPFMQKIIWKSWLILKTGLCYLFRIFTITNMSDWYYKIYSLYYNETLQSIYFIVVLNKEHLLFTHKALFTWRLLMLKNILIRLTVRYSLYIYPFKYAMDCTKLYFWIKQWNSAILSYLLIWNKNGDPVVKWEIY